MSTFSRTSRETLHDFNFFSVVKDTAYESTTDQNLEYRTVSHIGAVTALPVMDNGDVVLIEQYRPALDAMVLEVVAGRRDVDGEEPQIAAQREMIEEVAIQANEIIPLGYTYTSPGFTDEKIMMYLGTNCEQVEKTIPDGIEEELSIIHRISFEEALKMTLDGRICDAKSIVTLWKSAQHLGKLSNLGF